MTKQVCVGSWRDKQDVLHVDFVTSVDGDRLKYTCSKDVGTVDEGTEFNSSTEFWLQRFEPYEPRPTHFREATR